MSIRVRGTISIERKRGKRGDFNVGDLSTEIGVFSVKDATIEEFEPGKYSGEFLLTWVELDSFTWCGTVIVRPRATLEAVFIDEAEEGAAPPAAAPEPDPIEAAVQPIVQAASPAAAPVAEAAGLVAPATPTAPVLPAAHKADPLVGSEDDPLIGSLVEGLFDRSLAAQIAALQPVKLDPTVDRERFRAQRDSLRTLGYVFDPKNQTWAFRELAEA